MKKFLILYRWRMNMAHTSKAWLATARVWTCVIDDDPALMSRAPPMAL
jgi:hypothetical protein